MAVGPEPVPTIAWWRDARRMSGRRDVQGTQKLLARVPFFGRATGQRLV